jgi:hypothetical protein
MSTFSLAQNATTAKTTSIQFEEPIFNFGEIQQGEKIMNVFKFINTGEEPYLITNAKGSCGCTVPKYPKTAIMPGETGEIHVRFDSKGKKGDQSKRVTLTGNTETSHIYLTIKGQIVEVSAPLKQEQVVAEKPSKVQPFLSDYTISAMEVFPNPTSDFLHINLSEAAGSQAIVNIYDFQGKLITSQIIPEVNQDAIKFSIADYPTGSYVASLKVDGHNRLAKQFKVIQP